MVADGPGAALKAAVAAKRVRFRCERPDVGLLDGLEGVTEVDVQGPTVSIASLDADATVRSMVARKVAFSDLEVSSVGLAEAFLELTRAGVPRGKPA